MESNIFYLHYNRFASLCLYSQYKIECSENRNNVQILQILLVYCFVKNLNQ